MKCIRIHCGSSLVKGPARKYSYFVASLFESRTTKKGKVVFKNSGLVAGPFRSLRKTEKEAIDWCENNSIEFVKGYGSLHNKECLVQNSLMD